MGTISNDTSKICSTMNILLLENEGSWRGQCVLKLNEGEQHRIDTFTDIQLKNPVEKLAELIVKDFIFIDLFIINVNLIAGNQHRSACCGIKLIKLLRLLGLNQHCMLYSFLSREQLMELSPENLILFSPGLTYYQLPFDFKNSDLTAVSKKVAPTNLTAYLKAESKLPDDRHFFANFWGPLQLWKVHKNICPMEDSLKRSIQDQLFSSSKEIDYYQGLLAQYLYGHEIQKFSEAYIESKREMHNYFLHFVSTPETYRQQISQLDEKIELSTKEHLWNIEVLKAMRENNYNWQNLFLNLSQKPKRISDKINHLNIGITENTTEKERISRFLVLKEFIEAEERRISLEREGFILQRNVMEASYKESLEVSDENLYRQLLIKKSPKILYIDDQAEEGWATIFQLMIYGEINPDCFQVIQPNKSSVLQNVIKQCFEYNKSFDPDLIILDLRLLGESGTIENLNELSGVKVLKALKTGFKVSSTSKYSSVNCPVMVVTASNKAFTYQFINAMGANTYWIKEGLDNKLSLVDSIHNYRDLIWKVYIACYSEEFIFLKRVKLAIERFKGTKSEFWWESDTRFSKLLTKGANLGSLDKSLIFSILSECSTLIESLLQGKVLKNLSIAFETSVPSLIAIRLFHIAEIIHDEHTNESDEIGIKKRIVEHHKNAPVGKLTEILKIRNNAAHNNSISLEDLEQLFTWLIEYLENKPEVNSIAPNTNTLSTVSNDSIKDNQPNKKYTSTIVKKMYDHILISRNTDELQKDFSMDRHLQCFERNVIKDLRCREGKSVEFEVKTLTEDTYMALNLTFL